MSERDDIEDPALSALLATVTDPRERETVTKAYFSLSAGEANSFPVQFALLGRAFARAHQEHLSLLTSLTSKHTDAVKKCIGDFVAASESIKRSSAEQERLYQNANQQLAEIKQTIAHLDAIQWKNQFLLMILAFGTGLLGAFAISLYAR